MVRLKQEIIKKNITQYQLAKLIGAKSNTVNNWFKGRAKCPRDNYLNKIADVLNVHPAWLKYGDREYAPKENDEILYLIQEAEKLGVKEDGIAYLKYRISDAKRLKHAGARKSKTLGYKAGSG